MKTFKCTNGNRNLIVERIGEHLFFVVARGSNVLSSFELNGDNINHLLEFLTQYSPTDLNFNTIYETTYKGEDWLGRQKSMKVMTEHSIFHFIFKDSSHRVIATLADSDLQSVLSEVKGDK